MMTCKYHSMMAGEFYIHGLTLSFTHDDDLFDDNNIRIINSIPRGCNAITRV